MIKKLKYWCHKILPLAYDDSLSYYEVLAKVGAKINELVDWANGGIEQYIQEAIGDIFVDTTYDEPTETLKFSFNDLEGEGTSGDISNIAVNGFSRPVKDAQARTALSNISGRLDSLANTIDLTVGNNHSNILIVAKQNARFNRINDAIDYAKTYCSQYNRVTIVIVGGGNALYEESIDLDNNPGIDFLGVGSPRIRSSVAWRYSTLRCSNSITCEGIIFENYYSPQSGEHSGYGLHADPITGEQIYVNCRFLSDHNSGAGLGMGNNGSATFINCEFLGTNGVYLHNNPGNEIHNQWCRFYNCTFRGSSGNPGIRVYDAAYATNTNYVSEMGLIFANCTGYPSDRVQYLYDNTHSVNYIPSTGKSVSSVPSSNIFLVSSSISPGIIGVDYDRNVFHIYSKTESYGNAYYIPLENAYKYNFEILNARYSVDNGQTFIDVSDTSTISLSADRNYGNGIRVEWYGWVAGRISELNIKCTAK